ncbi:MAG: hypothetical protein K6G01_04250 [Eubacterium sp.]|nr:hypothetical protein [Eubacterium sp.]
MGLFDAIKGAVGTVKEIREEDAKEEQANEERPSVRGLEFTTLSASMADTIKEGKAGLIGGKDKKKFINAIKEGKVEYAKVAVVGSQKKVVEFDMDDMEREYYYVKIADLDGWVYKEDVVVMNQLGRPARYESPEGTNNADRVDASGYYYMYVLHYCLGKREYYMAMSEKEFQKMSDIVKYIGFQYECLGDGLNYVW